MAELLGIVAGGAGLASLTIQLAENAQKLRGLYKAYTKAPQFLEDAAFDLETFNHALDRLLQDRADYSAADIDLVQRCIQRCQRDSNSINTIISKLDSAMQKCKILGKLRAAFDTSEIAKLQDDLERSKSSLSFTLQLYMDSCRRYDVQQFRSILQATNIALIQQSNALQAQGSSLQSIQKQICGRGGMADNTTTTHARDAPSTYQTVTYNRTYKRRGKRYRLVIPSWFTAKTWAVSFSAMPSGWSAHITVSNEVSHNSPIIRACRDGDLAMVRRLFQEGVAAPTDHCTSWSLLEIAVYFPHSTSSELCQYLISVGASTHAAAKTLGRFAICRPYQRECDPSHMYRVLLEHADLDLGESTSLSMVTRCPDITCLRLVKSSLGHDWNEISGLDLLRCVVSMASYNKVDPQLLYEVFGSHDLPRHIATAHDNEGRGAFHTLAGDICLIRHADEMIACANYSAIVEQLLSMDADIHLRNGAGMTPLTYCLLFDYDYDGDYLRQWVSILDTAGIDLIRYGEVESSLWRAYLNGSSTGPVPCPPDRSLIRLQWTFGSRPEDWTLCLNPRIVRIFEPRPAREQTPGAWPAAAVPWPAAICWEPKPEDVLPPSWQWVYTRVSYLQPALPKPGIDGEYVDSEGDAHKGLDAVQGEDAAVSDYNDEYSGLAFRAVLEDTQDDAGVLALLVSRRSQACCRPRSSSLPRKTKQSQKNNAGTRHFWLPRYHRCLDGRYYIGKMTQRSCARGDCIGNTERYRCWSGLRGITSLMQRFRSRNRDVEDLAILPYSDYRNYWSGIAGTMNISLVSSPRTAASAQPATRSSPAARSPEETFICSQHDSSGMTEMNATSRHDVW